MSNIRPGMICMVLAHPRRTREWRDVVAGTEVTVIERQILPVGPSFAVFYLCAGRGIARWLRSLKLCGDEVEFYGDELLPIGQLRLDDTRRQQKVTALPKIPF